MAEYDALSLEELNQELKKQEALLEDVRYEREFLGKQAGMHINASEFARLDRDAERAEEKIGSIKGLISAKSG